jgi:hypothetical protein
MTSGSSIIVRKTQSGSQEQRRFGSGTPDRWGLPFQFRQSEYLAFEEYYNEHLNHGTKWFWADWLARLGYSEGHYAMIIGFPKVKYKNLPIFAEADLQINFLVMEIST